MKITELSQQSAKHSVSLTKAEILDKVLLFFRENVNSTREDFLKITKDLNISTDQLLQLEFDLCKSLCSKIGKHISLDKEPFSESQIAKGIKHELEHTNDEYIARMIALDHLYEMPDYYDQLEKIDKH